MKILKAIKSFAQGFKDGYTQIVVPAQTIITSEGTEYEVVEEVRELNPKGKLVVRAVASTLILTGFALIGMPLPFVAILATFEYGDIGRQAYNLNKRYTIYEVSKAWDT